MPLFDTNRGARGTAAPPEGPSAAEPAPDRRELADAFAAAIDRVEDVIAASRGLLDQLERGRSAGAGESQVASILDALVAGALQLGSEAAELSRRLEATRRGLGLPEVEVGGPEPEEPDRGVEVPAPSEGLRLLITQMAVAGSSRDQIASELRHSYGIAEAEAEAAVDHVLDSSSG